MKQINTKNYVKPDLVRHALDNSKGRFMAIQVEKKDGSLRTFNFKPAKENPPSFQYHKNLVPIQENGVGYRSFDINKVLSIKFDKQEIKAS